MSKMWKKLSLSNIISLSHCSWYDSVEGTVQPALCPVGYYCPPGLILGLEFPCPPGTVQSQLGASSPEACLLCPAGTEKSVFFFLHHQNLTTNYIANYFYTVDSACFKSLWWLLYSVVVSCRNVLLSACSVPANRTLWGWILLSCWINQP